MTTYLVRRLLLMIPTLIGITFLVFMLVALSPGGIGAALNASGGGAMDASAAATQQAYLEDRYGLNDPPALQYLRWLGRVSPIKFGARDQVSPSGELLRSPREIPEPRLRSWWGLGASGAGAASASEGTAPLGAIIDDASRENLVATYSAAVKRASAARNALIGANVKLERALATYAREAKLSGAIERNGKPIEKGFRSHEPRTDFASWSEVLAAGAASLDAHRAASAAQVDLAALFALKPHPEAGVPLIPGVLSLAWPDLGTSFSKKRDVGELILEALPVTLLLNFIAFPIIYLVAVPSGMLAAARRGTWIDVSLGAGYVALWSIPAVWAGVLAMGYLASPQNLGWFPVSGLHDGQAANFAFLPGYRESLGGAFSRGWLLDTFWHLCLPVACLVYGGFAILSKQTRAAMLENFSADYVRTAKAKGVPRKDVIFRHVFRNSLLPLITMFVGLFPAMLSGSVVIERIFSVPGMGSLAIESINLRDREVILANTLMIAGVNLLALLLADILYAIADPRVSYE